MTVSVMGVPCVTGGYSGGGAARQSAPTNESFLILAVAACDPLFFKKESASF
jgi:hypothetical protein